MVRDRPRNQFESEGWWILRGRFRGWDVRVLRRVVALARQRTMGGRRLWIGSMIWRLVGPCDRRDKRRAAMAKILLVALRLRGLVEARLRELCDRRGRRLGCRLPL